MVRVQLTRKQFKERFGYAPDPDSIGICFTNQARTKVVEEYVFTDEVFPNGKQTQIDSLEWLLANS